MKSKSRVGVKWSKFLGLDDCERNLQHDFRQVEEFHSVEPSVKGVSLTEACCQSNTAIAYKLHCPEVRQTSRGGRLKSPENMSISIRHA